MTKVTISAGGILHRFRNHCAEIVVVERTDNVEPKWLPVLRQLPKGQVESGETLERAACREVKEETGYDPRILSKAGTARWRYRRDLIQWKEIVHYYLMVPEGLQHPHDREFQSVRWLPVDQALKQLSYPEERALLRGVVNRGTFKL